MLYCHVLDGVNVVITVEGCQVDLVNKVLVYSDLFHLIQHTILANQGVCHLDTQWLHGVGL